MNSTTLVRPLLPGPIDIVGDVHGEFATLMQLLAHLGYDRHGGHPAQRRLVFVGDLGDRGPDSPAVIEWVRDRILDGRAQAVLGNHDFNALEAAAGGKMKTELSWLFDEARPYSHEGTVIPQESARGKRRDDLLDFLRTLPVALERGESPVRVVHASWEPTMIERLRHRTDVVKTYRQEKQALQAALDVSGEMNKLTRTLLHQNCNPVKRLTSGLEGRLTDPILINEAPRWEGRLPWWNDYRDPVLCVVGHYWRISLPDDKLLENHFSQLPLNAMHGGQVMCVDYSVGKRFRERLAGTRDNWRTRLAALRLPEKQLIFDNGETMPLLP